MSYKAPNGNRAKLYPPRVALYMFLFFMLNRLFTIEWIRSSPTLTLIYARASVAAAIVVVIFYIWNCGGVFRLSNVKAILLALAYALLMLLNTILQEGSVREWLSIFYPILATLCLIDYASKKHSAELTAAIAYLLYGLVVINLIDAILFKDMSEMYSSAVFFLGGRNQLGILFAIGMAFVAVHAEQARTKGSRFLVWSYIAVVTVSSILFRSATTLICTAAMIFLYCFRKNKAVNSILTPKRYLIIYGLIWLGIVVLRVQNLAADLIYTLFHRSASLTDRTLIWDVALSAIAKRPLTGYGIPYDGNLFTVTRVVGKDPVTLSYSGHNEIIQQLYEGGILLLLVFLVFYFVCTSRKKMSAPYFRYFYYAVILISIVWLTEASGWYGMYLALGLCFYAGAFSDAPCPKISRGKDMRSEHGILHEEFI